MASKWEPVPIESRLFQNVNEAVLTKASAALENCFINEAEGHTRFPGLKDFVTLSGNQPTYLHEWRGSLMAASGGNLWEITKAGVATDVTDIPVGGGKRVIFDRTENELIMTAGFRPVRFGGVKTEKLSENAPDSTHVAFVDGYVLLIEKNSGRFYHSNQFGYTTWDALDVFTADGKPDDLNAMAVTPYREVILTGLESVEQFERLPSGTIPFFRRWAVGEGISAPYTLLAIDNGTWGVDKQYEFNHFAGQISTPKSDDVSNVFERVDNWDEAWTARLHIHGQKFIILQIPYATNIHGTKGITALYEYRKGFWTNLYDWDTAKAQPARWPGWSYYPLWGKHYVGGEGKIFELDIDTYANGANVQRMIGRTGHIDSWGESRIDNVRIRIKRGVVAEGATEPQIMLRVLRDNNRWTKWIRRGLGTAGKRIMEVEFGGTGCAHTHQFEYMITDACEAELVSMDVQLTPLGE